MTVAARNAKGEQVSAFLFWGIMAGLVSCAATPCCQARGGKLTDEAPKVVGARDAPLKDSVESIPARFRNTLQMEMVLVPAGEFRAGVPEGAWTSPYVGERFRELNAPANAAVKRPFYIAATEVTVAQYRAFLDASHYAHPASTASRDELHARDDLPVTLVSWDDANAFCAWLSERESRSYDLPTQVQWEWACRAGSTGLFCFGDQMEQLNLYGWYKANSEGRAHEVASLQPNGWGLYDMHGNVAEWCREVLPKEFLERGDAPPDYLLTDVAPIRGGTYSNSASGLYCGARWMCYPVEERRKHVGFRVICEAPEQGI